MEATDDGSWKKWDKVNAEELESMKKAGITFEDMEKPILGPRDTNYIHTNG